MVKLTQSISDVLTKFTPGLRLERKKWLTKDSPAYNNLEKVVLDKRNLKDMEQLTNPLHTGSLEVFHSLINCYAPKRLGFELNVQDARVKLAIINHNNNVGKEQARIRKVKHGSGKEGELRFKYVSSKLSKEWVPKPIMDPKSFSKFWKISLSEKKQARKLTPKQHT